MTLYFKTPPQTSPKLKVDEVVEEVRRRVVEDAEDALRVVRVVEDVLKVVGAIEELKVVEVVEEVCREQSKMPRTHSEWSE